MRARRIVLSLAIGATLAASPTAGQSQTATRGLFQGPVPADASVGTLRGPISSSTSVGATRGAVPAEATIGTIQGPLPPGATKGAITRTPSEPAAAPAEGSVSTPLGAFRGILPSDARAGALATPLPPGSRFGEPGATDVAVRLEAEARLSLIDGNYRQAEAMLYRAVTMHERAVGADHPDVARALEDNARLLRQWSRSAAADDMAARAREIRARLEPPSAAAPAETSPVSPRNAGVVLDVIGP